MTQINFRVNKDEKLVLQALAELKGVSVAEFAKQVVLKDIGAVRVDLAFKLLNERKISRKRAWILSGLTYHEFMLEWAERHAEEIIPDAIMDKVLETALTIDFKQFLKKQLEKSDETPSDKT